MADQDSILELVLTRDEVTEVLRLLDQEGYWPEASYTVRDVVDATHEEPQRVYQALLTVRDPSLAAAKNEPLAGPPKVVADPDSLTPEEIRLLRLWLSRMERQWRLGWVMFFLVGIPLLLIAAALVFRR